MVIAQVPHGEREEVRQLLVRNGLSGDALDQAIASITSDADHWVETMMREEHGLTSVMRSPMKAARRSCSGRWRPLLRHQPWA